jgi:hypothetical protein
MKSFLTDIADERTLGLRTAGSGMIFAERDAQAYNTLPYIIVAP